MGHGHHDDFKIPHYSTYNNYRELPALRNHENRLARLGLKDPWIRNYAFMFQGRHTVTQWAHFKHLMSWGFKPGVAAAVVLIGLEEAYSYMKHGHTSWAASH
ncbi:hypothetical protein FO519_008413 [Halicephalobus sp. NKZ332]|nr:hypothetical protein FO519_008413 [Halicephalobus sp. NKZ332]